MTALVVALDAYSGEGGIARYTRRVLRALAEAGVAATVVSLWDPPEAGRAAPQGVTHIGCGRSKWRMLAAYLRAVRTRPDVVVIGHVLLAPLALAAPRAVLFAYGLETWRRPGALARAALRTKIARVVAISRTTMTHVVGTFGVPAERIDLLPPAVDPPVVVTPSPRLVGETHRVVCVSRLSRAAAHKGIEDVIGATALLAPVLPGIRVVIAGDGDAREALERLARDAGVAAHVRFAGWLPDDELDALYASGDCFVLPSSAEGFGIVYLEAWRHGLPVVAARAAAAAEVVRDGVTGTLVPFGDPVTLASAIGGLLSDPQRRRALGGAGRAEVMDRYAHASFRATLSAIVARITGDEGRRAAEVAS